VLIEDQAALQKRLRDFLDEEGALDVSVDADSDALDGDYVQKIGNRPTSYEHTWRNVYSARAFNKEANEYQIYCHEKGCGKIIRMDSKFTEIDSRSTPHGEPRKPPVCHKVSWAALEEVMIQQEGSKQKSYTDAFRKYVCWYEPNLQPGHNGCNSAGQKTTAQNISKDERTRAESIITTVTNEFKSTIWETYYIPRR
jgi:hypothetical protein